FTVTAAPTSLHVWTVPAQGGSARRLTSGAWSLPVYHPPGPPSSPFTWTPDGGSIVFTQQAGPHTGGGQQRSLQILNVADGTFKPLDQRGTVPVYSPDGTMFVYTGSTQAQQGAQGGGQNDIFLVSPGTKDARNLTSPIDRNMARALWMPDGKSLIVGANDDTKVSLWNQPLDGPATKLDLGDVS